MADVASDDLLDIDEVCAFFGGTKPLHPSTIWRGGGVRFPKPVNIGPNTVRWLRSECDAALQKLIEARSTPQKLIEARSTPQKLGAPKPALPTKKQNGRPRKRVSSELQT